MLAKLPKMELSQDPPNREIKKENYPGKDSRVDINYRQNLRFKIFVDGQSSDLNTSNFWDKFSNLKYGEWLIVSDKKYDLKVSSINFIDYVLLYDDKNKENVYKTRLNDLSAEFTKKVLISFCENKNEWKTKLEWEHMILNSRKKLMTTFSHYATLIMVVLFVYFKRSEDLFSERLFAFLEANNINIVLVGAIFMVVLLIFDRNEIKNYGKIGAKSKFWIGLEACCLVMFVLFLFSITIN